jgi:hypothetical protein
MPGLLRVVLRIRESNTVHRADCHVPRNAGLAMTCIVGSSEDAHRIAKCIKMKERTHLKRGN